MTIRDPNLERHAGKGILNAFGWTIITLLFTIITFGYIAFIWITE